MAEREELDPTAGESAKQLYWGVPARGVPTDPTAGESARRSREEPAIGDIDRDPTDPRCGESSRADK